MNSSVAGLPNTSRCPRCGAGFRCGNVAGDAECWCTQLPNVMPVPSAQSLQPDDDTTSCFCPACIKQITDDQLRTPSPSL